MAHRIFETMTTDYGTGTKAGRSSEEITKANTSTSQKIDKATIGENSRVDITIKAQIQKREAINNVVTEHETPDTRGSTSNPERTRDSHLCATTIC